MKVRVLRVMEYTYADADAMVRDMAHWQVQGEYRPNRHVTIRSVALPPELVEDMLSADSPD